MIYEKQEDGISLDSDTCPSQCTEESEEGLASFPRAEDPVRDPSPSTLPHPANQASRFLQLADKLI